MTGNLPLSLQVDGSPENCDNVQPNPRKRRRPARSCQECRRRKVKCNLSEPCGHCVLSKKQCHYGHGSAQDGRNVNDRAPPGGRSVHGRTPNVRADVPCDMLPRPTVSTTGPSPSSDASRSTGRAAEVHVSVQGSRGIAGSSNPGEETSNATQDDVTHGPPEGRFILNKSRLFGQSHWTNSTLDVRCID